MDEKDSIKQNSWRKIEVICWAMCYVKLLLGFLYETFSKVCISPNAFYELILWEERALEEVLNSASQVCNKRRDGFEDPKPASKRAPGIWIIPGLWRTNEPCLSQLPRSWEGIRNLRLCALSKFSTVSYSSLRKVSSLWAEAPNFYTWVVPALSLCQAMTCKPTAEDTGGTALRSPLARQKNKGK